MTLRNSPRDTKSPAEDTMFTYSHLFVRLFSRIGPDGKHVVTASIHPEGQRILLEIFSRQGEYWTATFSESDVNDFRAACNPALKWQKFLELLRKTFAENLIEFDAGSDTVKFCVKHERQTEAIPLPPFVCHVPVRVLRTASKEAASNQARAMANYAELRVGDSKTIDRFKQVSVYEQHLKEDAEQLEAEVSFLQSAIESHEATIAAYNATAPTVLQKIRLIPALAGWENALGSSDTRKIVCRFEDPCSESTDNDGDVELRIPTPLLIALKSACLNLTQICENAGMMRFYKVAIPRPKCEESEYLSQLSPTAISAVTYFSSAFSTWDANIFELHALAEGCGGSALVFLGYASFCTSKLPMKFNMDERKLLNWLSLIAAGHRPPSEVPYHNAIHATATLHSLYYMLYYAKAIEIMSLTDMDILCATIAALIHDFGHRGFSNRFYLDTNSPLAQLYSGSNLVQNNAVAQVFELMKLPKYNILDGVAFDTRIHIQQRVLDLVVATDWHSHTRAMSIFRRIISAPQPNFQDEIARLKSLGVLMKAADISHCAKPRLYQKWASALHKELENEFAIRSTSNVFTGHTAGEHANDKSHAEVQLAIINEIAIPVFSALSEVLPSLSSIGSFIGGNKDTLVHNL